MSEKFLFIFIYQRYLGLKIYIVFLLAIASTLLENIGILMVLPLLDLSMNDESNNYNSYIVDHLKNIFDYFEISISISNSLAIIVFIFCMKGLFIFGTLALNHIYHATLSRLLRKAFLDAYSNVRLAFFIRKNSGDFLNVLTDQTTKTVATSLFRCDNRKVIL